MILSRTHVLSANQIRRFWKPNWAKLVSKIAQFGFQNRPNCFAEKYNPKANRGESGRNFGFYHRKRVIISFFIIEKMCFGRKAININSHTSLSRKDIFIGNSVK